MSSTTLEDEDETKPAPGPKYEFGGPAGALGVMLGLPLVVYSLYFGCSPRRCEATPEALEDILYGLQYIPRLFNIYAGGLFVMWLVSCAFLERVLPGDKVKGARLKDGSQLSYVLNGHLQFWVTLLVLAVGAVHFVRMPVEYSAWTPPPIKSVHPLPLAVAYDHYLSLLTASVLFSFALSFYLYSRSFVTPTPLLAEGGQTGSVIYDFFIGRELNPRIGSFDLKVFCELRPGLIGWAVLNLGCAFKQYEKLGHLTLPMVLVNAFQGLYVWDAVFYEQAILTTMDVTTDGFGFMLAFGDLCWVPFTYSLQARYLVDHDPNLSLPVLVTICLLKALGYLIFRGANSEKDAFRRNPESPELAHLKTIYTARGRRLLVSGWWGLARKINYTGDWLMGLSWCLLCGFDSVVPYFYAIYFGVLLVHRAIRDDHMCAEKYGDDWKRYKDQVRYAFIPYIV